MALAGSEERADWEGSASNEHHSCSVYDRSRVQNAVGHSPENFGPLPRAMLRRRRFAFRAKIVC
jgi:hypothetical protein